MKAQKPPTKSPKQQRGLGNGTASSREMVSLSNPITSRLPAEPNARFKELDGIVANWLESSFDAGRALWIIREEELWKGEFKSFEHYCEQRWELSRAYVCRLINAAQLTAEMLPLTTKLLPMGNIPAPNCERQIRPLLRLKEKPEKAAEAWAMAVKMANGGQITAQHVNDAVAELGLIPNPRKNTPRKGTPTTGLRELLILELKRLNRLVEAQDIEGILQRIEHMKILIERYGSPQPQLDGATE
jgi:hypothetical protein